MKGSDLFVKCLENEGVEYIFGIPGEETLDLIDSLSKLHQHIMDSHLLHILVFPVQESVEHHLFYASNDAASAYLKTDGLSISLSLLNNLSPWDCWIR